MHLQPLLFESSLLLTVDCLGENSTRRYSRLCWTSLRRWWMSKKRHEYPYIEGHGVSVWSIANSNGRLGRNRGGAGFVCMHVCSKVGRNF
jgi:hypothetical protein